MELIAYLDTGQDTLLIDAALFMAAGLLTVMTVLTLAHWRGRRR